MSKEKRLVPELRFSEFDGEWKHLRLSDVTTRVTRKNKNLETDLPLTISAEYGLVDQSDFFNRYVASKDMSGYYLLKKGEFAYNKSYSNGNPWGVVRRLTKYDQGALSSLYICFSANGGFDPDFIEKYFQSNVWHKEVSMIAVEGARNHGLLNVSVNEFFETLHYLPSYNEQKKIATFLSLIDNKIELLEKKVELLEEQKRGLLQKIFSQEIRFKKDDGSEYKKWKTKRLNEIVDYQSSNLSQNMLNDISKDDYEVYGANGVVGTFKTYSFDKHYITIIKDGAGVGRIQKCKPYTSAIGTLGIILNNEESNIDFVYYLMQMIDFTKYVVGSTIPHVYFKDYGKINMDIPTLEEQSYIADFFNKHDLFIDSTRNKLEKTNQLKNGLLHELFL